MEEEIKRMKREKNAVILAHNYQLPEIQDIADFVGDSLELARKATQIDAKKIFFCGVYFMAETAAILNPDKEVYIPSEEALCPLAASLDVDEMVEIQEKNPDALTVVYINTRAIAKKYADAVCTSANAPEIVCSAPSQKIIFGPDSNLAYYVKKKCPDKEIIVVPEDGHCYVHVFFSGEDVEKARKKHPDALVIVHPECPPEVQEIADYIGSTGQMVKLCGKLNANKFLIGTEREMCYRLKKLYPEKEFIPIREDAICKQMKKITLKDLYESMKEEKYLVEIHPNIAKGAKKAIERMLEGW